MATIVKRGNSHLVVYRYTDARGKSCQKWESFSTQKEAKSRLQEIEVDMRNGTFIIPSSMTVSELFAKWLPIQSGKHKWAPQTYSGTSAMIDNLIVPYIGNITVQSLRPYHLEELYKTLGDTPCGLYVNGEKQTLTEKQQQRKLSGTTIHVVHSLLRTVFSYAVEWDIIPKTPVPRDGPKLSTQERAIWDEQAVASALHEIDNPVLHLAVHLTFVASLRLGELLGLTPEDLDFDAADGRGTISVNKCLQRVTKESLKKIDTACVLRQFEDQREYSTTALILKGTKTKKSKRLLYMTDPLKQELHAWLEHLQREQQKNKSYTNSGMLFRLPNGKPIEQTLIRKWFQEWEVSHPDYERIVFHALRHSSATYQLTISEGDIKAVQGNTGHAQAGILLNTYAHIQDDSRLKLSQKFETGFYAKQKSTPTAQNGGADTKKMDALQLLEVLKQADPEVKREFARALFA